MPPRSPGRQVARGLKSPVVASGRQVARSPVVASGRQWSPVVASRRTSERITSGRQWSPVVARWSPGGRQVARSPGRQAVASGRQWSPVVARSPVVASQGSIGHVAGRVQRTMKGDQRLTTPRRISQRARVVAASVRSRGANTDGGVSAIYNPHETASPPRSPAAVAAAAACAAYPVAAASAPAASSPPATTRTRPERRRHAMAVQPCTCSTRRRRLRWRRQERRGVAARHAR